MDARVDVLIVGAGPAGLRAAQVLADAGRDVLVVERNPQVGPKTCAGGLTAKAFRELVALDFPDRTGVAHAPTVSLCGETPRQLDEPDIVVRTVARTLLGQWQLERTRLAGAHVMVGTDVRRIDLAAQRVQIGATMMRYDHLIGADGSASRVRRALGLPVARAYFAGEFNVPGDTSRALLIAFDSRRLASGYYWIFPHATYTSFGAGAPVSIIRPAAVRRYLEALVAGLGIASVPPFEAATIEVEFAGFHFARGVHLAGDAAGVASPVTGEGIYAALITGEEVARTILDPTFHMPKSRAWLRTKRAHDLVARAWLSRPLREASFRLIKASLTQAWSRRPVSAFFVAA